MVIGSHFEIIFNKILVYECYTLIYIYRFCGNLGMNKLNEIKKESIKVPKYPIKVSKYPTLLFYLIIE